ncbi:MAG: hypothetical protein ACE5G6_02045 [Terriglobia bacterium]
MKARLASLLLAAALASVVGAQEQAAPAQESKPTHHHDLRGVITKVEPEENRFEIRTGGGRVVLCVVDKETTLKRGDKKITLADVQPGERAHCHCAALRDGRHYSQSLHLEKKKKDD